MQEIFDLLKSMPEYVKTLFTNHLIMACIAAVSFSLFYFSQIKLQIQSVLFLF